jgi:hypothetical protein
MRIHSSAACILLATMVLATAQAEVLSAGPGGFQLRHQVSTALAPDAAYQRFLSIARWWSDAHTYSGRAAGLSIDARPGGCWCEQLANGGALRHMTAIYLDPGKALRFEGGLGPLQPMGATGVMTIAFKPAATGSGSAVTLVYNVSGYAAEGLAGIAPAVDQVLAEQLARFAAP